MNLLKMQDMMEIINMLNRIKYNSYDDNYKYEARNMNQIEKTENIIRILSKNSDETIRDNAVHLINLIHDMDSIKADVDFMNRRSGRNHIDENIRHSSQYGYESENMGLTKKVLFFLNSLNNEE